MTNELEFNRELAQNLIYSKEEFPVNLDDAWKWLGYVEKRNALRKLKDYFIENEDYVFVKIGESSPSGRSSDLYKLTVSCFKEMGMLAQTEKGKQIRKYFIECEELTKQVTQIPDELMQVLNQMQSEMKVLTQRTKELDEIKDASTKHKGCGNIIKAEVDKEDYDLVTAFEYLKAKGFGYEQANLLARRTAAFERSGKGNNYEPPKNKLGHLLFEIKYLDQAFLSICNF